MTKSKLYVIIFLLIILFVSCSEIKTNDPNEVYKHWAGTKPTSDIKLINGQYWQSAYWTKEYIMFLEIKPTKVWWNEFIKQNSLIETNDKWTKPENTPIWFNPSEKSKIYRPKDYYDDTRCFYNEKTETCFIYNIQF